MITICAPTGIVGYAGLGVRGLAVVLIARLAVLGKRRGFITDGRSLGVVTLADLFGGGV